MAQAEHVELAPALQQAACWSWRRCRHSDWYRLWRKLAWAVTEREPPLVGWEPPVVGAEAAAGADADRAAHNRSWLRTEQRQAGAAGFGQLDATTPLMLLPRTASLSASASPMKAPCWDVPCRTRPPGPSLVDSGAHSMAASPDGQS